MYLNVSCVTNSHGWFDVQSVVGEGCVLNVMPLLEVQLFHDRGTLFDGAFRHKPPTIKVDADGRIEQTSKYQ